MNILPWGGPTARAATALKLDPAVVFVPMIPAMLVCAAACITGLINWGLGLIVGALMGILGTLIMWELWKR